MTTAIANETSVENKKYLRYVLAALLLVGLGYAGGRYAQPTKVVTKTQIVTQTVDKIITQDRIVTQIQYVKVHDLAKNVHSDTITTKKPDGTVVTETKVDDTSKSQTLLTDASKTAEAKDQTQDLKQTVVATQTKTVTYDKPAWSLTLQPGFEFGSAFGYGGSTNLLSKVTSIKYIMANVDVEHRLVGPLFVGAWANSRLDGGVSLRLEW